MDEEKSTPNPSAVGGAAGEAGSDFRAAVGAWIVVHALAGKKLEGVGPSAMRPVPTGLVLAESDSPVDDLEVKLQGGLVLYIQAKRSLRIGKDPESEFGKAVAQCCALAGRDGFMTEKARMAIVVGESTQPLRALAKALERRRAPIAGKASTGERKALAVLSGHLQELEESTRASLLSALDVLILDMGSPNSAPRERGEAWLDGRVVPHGKASLAWDVIESKIKKLAKHRLGAGVSQWMSWLEQAGIEVLHSRHTPAGQAMELARASSMAWPAGVWRECKTSMPACSSQLIHCETPAPRRCLASFLILDSMTSHASEALPWGTTRPSSHASPRSRGAELGEPMSRMRTSRAESRDALVLSSSSCRCPLRTARALRSPVLAFPAMGARRLSRAFARALRGCVDSPTTMAMRAFSVMNPSRPASAQHWATAFPNSLSGSLPILSDRFAWM